MPLSSPPFSVQVPVHFIMILIKARALHWQSAPLQRPQSSFVQLPAFVLSLACIYQAFTGEKRAAKKREGLLSVTSPRIELASSRLSYFCTRRRRQHTGCSRFFFFIAPNLEPANAFSRCMSRCRQYPPTLVILLVPAQTHAYNNRPPAHHQRKKKILLLFFSSPLLLSSSPIEEREERGKRRRRRREKKYGERERVTRLLTGRE